MIKARVTKVYEVGVPVNGIGWQVNIEIYDDGTQPETILHRQAVEIPVTMTVSDAELLVQDTALELIDNWSSGVSMKSLEGREYWKRDG